MAHINLQIFSEALGMQTSVCIVIPQRGTSGEIGVVNNAKAKKYKCLYLLHGLSDDESIWMRRTSIERYASDYGICVVMPRADKSFYTDMKYGEKYYTYIAKELPAIIREFFNVSDKREDNFIAGLSMGGYGALKIAMKECDSFCAAAGLSPVADINRPDFDAVRVPIFGDDNIAPDDEDLFSIAKNANKNPLKPRIFVAIGTDDFMYDDNLRLKATFEKLDYDYKYIEDAGNHNWEFWDKYIQVALKWMFN